MSFELFTVLVGSLALYKSESRQMTPKSRTARGQMWRQEHVALKYVWLNSRYGMQMARKSGVGGEYCPNVTMKAVRLAMERTTVTREL